MLKKLVIIVVLIAIVVLIVLIKFKFTGEFLKIKDSDSEKEAIEVKVKKIRLLATDCTNGKLTMKIVNDGNAPIERNELRVFINEEEKTANFIDKGTDPDEATSYSDLTTTYSGKQNIRVEAPDNTIGWGITC